MKEGLGEELQRFGGDVEEVRFFGCYDEIVGVGFGLSSLGWRWRRNDLAEMDRLGK